MSLVSEGTDFRGSLSAGADISEPSLATVGDYFALMKPRVMSLVVFTALVGLAVAPGSLHPVTAFTALLCIAVGAGAAGALNMWYDADVDALMTRTSRRLYGMAQALHAAEHRDRRRRRCLSADDRLGGDNGLAVA